MAKVRKQRVRKVKPRKSARVPGQDAGKTDSLVKFLLTVMESPDALEAFRSDPQGVLKKARIRVADQEAILSRDPRRLRERLRLRGDNVHVFVF